MIATRSCIPFMPIGPNIDPAILLPPFESSLPAVLRLSGERALLKYHALTRETYSTAGCLSDSPDNNKVVLKTIPVATGALLICEGRSPELARYCAEHGLRLASDDGADRATSLLEAAVLKVVQPYSFLWSAVSELAWRCHILLSQDDDYDVSFSDPAIPFSVFISAPVRDDRISTLRVAENLVHETMHLQLTLFENLCPLVDTASTWSIYSPWKQQKRPAQGALHGLYVFCILRWMWRQLSQTTRDRTDIDFALRRISEIDEEVSAVRNLEESPALTDAGRHFLHHLFLTLSVTAQN